MTDNEKLIEQARSGDHRATRPGLILDLANALETAEKAHTPTDDEREAQGWREAALYAEDAESQDDFMTGWRTADRLRRSEVPEYSGPISPDDLFAARPEPQGEPSDAVANAVARAIIEHDEDRLTCYDHPDDFCCPCGEHGMSRSEWQRHRARAALRAAAAAVTEKEEGKES